MESHRIKNSIDIAVDNTRIAVSHYLPPGACSAGSPVIMTNEEALALAFFIIKRQCRINEVKNV